MQATRYRRSFALSGELDTERIEASLKDGVLTLRIPKRAEFRRARSRSGGLTGSTAPDRAPFGSLTAAPCPAAQ